MMWHSWPPELVFTSCFLNIMVEVKSLGQPHILKVWFGVSEGMLPV